MRRWLADYWFIAMVIGCALAVCFWRLTWTQWQRAAKPQSTANARLPDDWYARNTVPTPSALTQDLNASVAKLNRQFDVIERLADASRKREDALLEEVAQLRQAQSAQPPKPIKRGEAQYWLPADGSTLPRCREAKLHEHCWLDFQTWDRVRTHNDSEYRPGKVQDFTEVSDAVTGYLGQATGRLCRDDEMVTTSKDGVLECVPRAKPLPTNDTYAPNRCPVCGEMAEPYKPKPDRWCADSQVFDPETGKFYSGCDPALLPKSRVTRCKRCSAAFWQSAEEEKKP